MKNVRSTFSRDFCINPFSKLCFSIFKKAGAFALNRARLAAPEVLAIKQEGDFSLDRERLASPEALAFEQVGASALDRARLASPETLALISHKVVLTFIDVILA